MSCEKTAEKKATIQLADNTNFIMLMNNIIVKVTPNGNVLRVLNTFLHNFLNLKKNLFVTFFLSYTNCKLYCRRIFS